MVVDIYIGVRGVAGVSPQDNKRNDTGQDSCSQDDRHDHRGQQRACKHTRKGVKWSKTNGSCRRTGNRHSPSLQLRPLSPNGHLKEPTECSGYRPTEFKSISY